jgi:uncharacterized protein YbjT (DUF2867 family)
MRPERLFKGRNGGAASRAADTGAVAAELIQTTWSGRSVVELEGPRRVTPEEIAATFADPPGHPVRTGAVPRETWESLFKSQGMKNPAPRIQMLVEHTGRISPIAKSINFNRTFWSVLLRRDRREIQS